MMRSTGALPWLMMLCGSGCDGPPAFNGAIALSEQASGALKVFDVLNEGRLMLVESDMRPETCPAFDGKEGGIGVFESKSFPAKAIECDYVLKLGTPSPLVATTVGLIVAADSLSTNCTEMVFTLSFPGSVSPSACTPPEMPPFQLTHMTNESHFSSHLTPLGNQICLSIRGMGDGFCGLKKPWHLTDLKLVYTLPPGRTP